LSARPTQVSAGRVGKPHGLDGSFYVDRRSAELTEGTKLAAGTAVTVAGRASVVERRAGTDVRPLVRIRGIADRAAAAALHGADLLVDGGDLEEGEYLSADLVGCVVPGLGEVRSVIAGPSCDLLVVGDEELLIPFVSDAVAAIDLAARRIDVDRDFLALADEHESEEPGGPADRAEAGGDGGETADRGARP